MKILFIAPACSIHTIRWVNALAQRGNQVLLVSLSNHFQAKDILDSGVNIVYLPFSGVKGYYLNAYKLRKIETQFKPDVINVHYASGYGTLARISKIPNIILSVWGSDVYDFPYQNKFNSLIIKKNLKYAKKIASTSNAMARQVERLIGKKEITITPFGVDVNQFKKNPEIKKEENTFTIGIVKSLLPQYGIDTVIKAFAIFDKELDNKIIKRQLYIYGEGEEKNSLIKLCCDLDIENKVEFKGTIDNNRVPQALNQMDIACFGSRLESFGVSAVEAMACEVPVIATDVDGFREVLEDKVTGYIVKRDDPKMMAERMLELYRCVDKRLSIGKEGRKRVLRLYNWEENVNQMLVLYKEN